MASRAKSFLAIASFFLQNGICTLMDISAGKLSEVSLFRLAELGLDVWSFGAERRNSFFDGLQALDGFVPRQGTWIVDLGVTSYASFQDFQDFYSGVSSFVAGVVMLWPQMTEPYRRFPPPRYANWTELAYRGCSVNYLVFRGSSRPALLLDFEATRDLREKYTLAPS